MERVVRSYELDTGGSYHAPLSGVILMGAELEASKASNDVSQTLPRGGLGFGAPNHFPLVTDDEVKTPETDGRSGGPNDVVDGHPDLGEEDVKNMQGPYMVHQLSVFRTSIDE